MQTIGRYWLDGRAELAHVHALTLVAILSLGLVASILRGLRGTRPLGVACALVALSPLVALAPESVPVRDDLIVPLGALAGVALAVLVHALRSVRADARLRLAEATAWCAACAVLASWMIGLPGA